MKFYNHFILHSMFTCLYVGGIRYHITTKTQQNFVVNQIKITKFI